MEAEQWRKWLRCLEQRSFFIGWDKMKKRILITGGSGFVGRNVKEYLEAKEQYEV